MSNNSNMRSNQTILLVLLLKRLGSFEETSSHVILIYSLGHCDTYWCDTCRPTGLLTLQTHQAQTAQHGHCSYLVADHYCEHDNNSKIVPRKTHRSNKYPFPNIVIVVLRTRDVEESERPVFSSSIISLRLSACHKTSSRSSTLNARGIKSFIFPIIYNFVRTSCSGLK